MKVLIIVISIFQVGCASSSYLASVGARSMKGSQRYHDDMKVFELPIKVHKREFSSWGMIHGDFYPYTNLFTSSNGKSVGVIKFEKEHIKWSNKINEGVLTTSINNEKVDFDISFNGYEVEIERKFREWYSYPVQTLLVISMPLDLVIDVALIPLGLVHALF